MRAANHFGPWWLWVVLLAMGACSSSGASPGGDGEAGVGDAGADAGSMGGTRATGSGGGGGQPASGGRSGAGGQPATGGSSVGGAAGGAVGGSGGAVPAPVANFLDRLNFGDRGTGPTGELPHGMNLTAATDGAGMFGQTYRVIAPSLVAPGDPLQNLVLTFTMACHPSLQNYLTVKLWGGDTTIGVIYLFDAARGTEQSNYNGQSVPEIDLQENTTPMAPGRFVYVTMPIPLASTQGKHSVSLTLNGARSFSYYGGRTTAQLTAGQTTRPIYAAFTHTDPLLNLIGTDVQTVGGGPAAPTAPTPLVFDAAYVSSLQQRYTDRINRYRDSTLDGGRWVQAWGPAWDAAVRAGSVPAQVVGAFMGNVTPTDSRTPAAWLDLAATGSSVGNNNPMLHLDDLGIAFAQNLAPTYFHSAEVRQRVIAGLDAAFYLQSLNGALGGLAAWVGLGATAATTANPQGRLTAAGTAIEGNGTLALGSAFASLSTDATFLAALDANINDALVPGVKRFQAWQQLFSRHVTFLLGRHGSAPNQDMLQARSLIAAHRAVKFLDSRYGTALALADSTVIAYVQSACGVTASSKGPRWLSPAGLSLEVHGVGNGGYDGGYGMNGMMLLVDAAKMLQDAGLESDADHPVRDLAHTAVHAFANFVAPGATPANVATFRREEAITFRKNFNVGEIGAGCSYLGAFSFGDPVALHGFHLERTFGMSPPEWSNTNIDEGQNRMFRWGSAYIGLVQAAMAAASSRGGAVTDPSGVTLLHESAHPDGAWTDPVAGAISFKQNGQHGYVALNFRPYGYGDASAYVQPGATGTLSNIARLHFVTPSADRIVTMAMPTIAANGAVAGFTSGGYGGTYVAKYGPYVAALNLGTTASAVTVPGPVVFATAKDWVTGTSHDLTSNRTITVPAGSGVLLTLGRSASAAEAASPLAY